MNLPPHDPQQPFLFPVPGQPAAPKKSRKLPVVLAVVGGVLVLCLGGTVAIGVAASQGDTAGAAAPTAPVVPAITVATPTPAATDDPIVEETTGPPATTPPTKVSYKKLSDRDWKKIAKDPGGHAGETFVVYGAVTQFDAATGDWMFRADVGPKNEEESFRYDTNTILFGIGVDLSDLVTDDEFRANVRMTGPYSYDTQIGGSTTVPQLEVVSIKVL